MTYPPMEPLHIINHRRARNYLKRNKVWHRPVQGADYRMPRWIADFTFLDTKAAMPTGGNEPPLHL